MGSSIVIKVKYGDTLKRFNARVDRESICLSIDELKQKIFHLFKIPCDAEITLTYIDEDGDEITLTNDDDLKDIVKQELDPLRISVKLNTERSSEYSTPFRSPITQPSFPNENAGTFEHFKKGTELLHETLSKLSADMASKTMSSALPGISDLAETFSRMALSQLNQLLQNQSKTEPHLQRQVPENASGVTENNPCVDRTPSDVNEVLKPREAPVKHNEPRLTTTPESEAFINKKNASFNLSEPSIGSAVRDPEPTMFKAETQSGVGGKDFGDSIVGNALGISRSSVPSIIKNNADDNRGNTGFDSINLNGSTRSDNPLQSFWYLGDSRKISHDSHLSSVPPHPSTGSMEGHCLSGVQRAGNPLSPPHVPFDVPYKGSHGHRVETSKVFHSGVQCDGCGVHPIAGPRFKSKVKDDFDLCIICFRKMGSNDAEYIRIDYPNACMQSPYLYRGTRVKPNGPKLDCLFVEDVNVPDGTIFTPSTQFTKIWRMRNNGNIFWPKGTRLVSIGRDIQGNVMSVDLEITSAGFPVGKELDVAVDFVAPNSPGRYISHWSMVSPLGQKFGQHVWVQIQVVAPTEEPVRNPILENLRGLNLNLPPASSSPITPEMIDVNQEPFVGDSHPEPIISSNSTELFEPVIEGTPSMKEQEVKFPITDSLIAGFDTKRQPGLPATGGSSSISYPVIDMPNVAASIAPPLMPHVNVDEFAQEFNENSEVELVLLRELEEMGFKQIDLNKEILRLNKYDLEKSVDDLFVLSE